MEFATSGDQAGQLLADDSYSFKGFAFLHDFAITRNWAVFLQNAVAFNPLGFVLGQKGAAQCLSSKPGQQGQFWLVPRASGAFAGQKPRLIKAPEGFVFHHLNAFEDASGEVVVDSIFYADFLDRPRRRLPHDRFRQPARGPAQALPHRPHHRQRQPGTAGAPLLRVRHGQPGPPAWRPATAGWRWPSASTATIPCRRSRSSTCSAANGGSGARRPGALSMSR